MVLVLECLLREKIKNYFKNHGTMLQRSFIRHQGLSIIWKYDEKLCIEPNHIQAPISLWNVHATRIHEKELDIIYDGVSRSKDLNYLWVLNLHVPTKLSEDLIIFPKETLFLE